MRCRTPDENDHGQLFALPVLEHLGFSLAPFARHYAGRMAESLSPVVTGVAAGPPRDDAADQARHKLEELIRVFENESQAYTSLNLSMWTNRYGDYDDLARIKEWSAAGGLGIEEW